MGLKDRISKLETGLPGLECQSCGNKPHVILHGETVPQNCPDCGKAPFVIEVLSEKSREVTLAVIACQ